MDILAAISGGGIVVAVIAIVVLMGWYRGAVARGDGLAVNLAAMQTDDTAKTLAAERAQFDLDKATAALAAQTARANALEDYVAHQAQETDPAARLAPDDVAGRVLRMSQQWAAAVPHAPTAAAGPGPVAAGAVSAHTAAAAT